MLLLPPGRRRLPLGVSLWGGEGQQLQQLCWQVPSGGSGGARGLCPLCLVPGGVTPGWRALSPIMPLAPAHKAPDPKLSPRSSFLGSSSPRFQPSLAASPCCPESCFAACPV